MSNTKSLSDFHSTSECYSYFITKRLRMYDSLHTPKLSDLTNAITEDNRKECIFRIVAANNELWGTVETLFIAVRLFDFVITKFGNEKNFDEQLKIAGICMLLAYKYNEPPRIMLVYDIITKAFEIESFKEEDVSELEIEVLKKVGGDVFNATPTAYYNLALKTSKKFLTEEQVDHLEDLLAQTVFSIQCSQFKAESIIVAAVKVTCKLTNGEDLSKDFFGVDADDDCVKAIEEATTIEVPEKYKPRFDEYPSSSGEEEEEGV